MNTDPTNTPDKWTGEGTFRVPNSPDPGEYVNLGLDRFPDAAEGSVSPVSRILVWHWHTPADGPARWRGMGVGSHTLVSLEPLHLEPSLGCDEGCPAHGWIRNGEWINA